MSKNWQVFFLILILAAIILSALLGPWYLALFIIGGCFLVVDFYFFIKVQLSKRWLTTQGRIIASKVVPVYGYEGGFYFEPYILYNYFVDGKKFRGDRFSFTRKSPVIGEIAKEEIRETLVFGKFFAKKIIKPYPLGSKVRVYYNPHNPSESVLQPKVGWWILLLLTAVFIGVGLLGFFGII